MSITPYRIPKTEDSLFRRFGWSLAGIVKIRDRGRVLNEAMLSGSGTFIRLGNAAGILTAAHVLEQVRDETVGLITFHRDEPIMQFKLDLKPDEDFVYDPQWHTTGRDLAFLRIADKSRVGDLEALGCVFYNLDRERGVPAGLQEMFISGVVGETREVKHREGQTPITGFTALFAPADGITTSEGDRFSIVPLLGTAQPPQSYGGMSGGAAWLASSTDGPCILLGVMFQELVADDESMTIECESLWAAYRTLFPEIRRRFG